jgi:hypothetical protein
MGDIIGIGLEHFRTRLDMANFERSRLRGLEEEARYQKHRLQCEFGELVDTLRGLLHEGVAKTPIADALIGMIDAVEDADHRWNRDINEAAHQGLCEPAEKIDTSEARALLTELTP